MKEVAEGESRVFEIPEISPIQIDALKERVKTTIWPNELEKEYGWDYGAPTWAVQPLLEEWGTSFDWDELRQDLGQWKHYQMKVEGLMMHYIHEPSDHPDAIPLVLLHGWPSTFYEFHKLIKPLRDGAGKSQSFHVIVPSLPGFGFSEAPKEKGYGAIKMASMINRLLVNLGYDRYVYHGGDWGAIIGKRIAAHHNNNCKALHATMPVPIVSIPTVTKILLNPFKMVKIFASLVLGFDRVYGAGRVDLAGATFANAERNTACGYRAIQGTRPYTLAYGLTDSPVGLLAWMLEKYHEWTFHLPEKQHSEALPQTIQSKEFLTQVSIYWMTNSMSSSIRIYYEVLHQKEMIPLVLSRTKVPVAISSFASEISQIPKDWFELSTDLYQFTQMECGGHFAGLEEPQLLLSDLQRFGEHLKRKRIF
ncbi:Alpha/Beta hydrolase protein [Sporodiniella umbellata]|nr:Alpha/Beta hydrolase protein [Sporodiniella umbellata]